MNSQTAAAAMLSLPAALPFHSLIPVPLPVIDHTRHLIMSNNTNPWANSSQLLFQQLSTAAAAAARNQQPNTQQAQNSQQQHLQSHTGQQTSNQNNSGNQHQQSNYNSNNDQLDTGYSANLMASLNNSSTPSVRMLQQGQNSWRSPFLLDPSIANTTIKTEQLTYGYPNPVNSAAAAAAYHSQRLNSLAGGGGSGNSSASAAAAAAAMFYPIELGDSSMFGRINVPFANNNSGNIGNSQQARQQLRQHNSGKL